MENKISNTIEYKENVFLIVRKVVHRRGVIVFYGKGETSSSCCIKVIQNWNVVITSRSAVYLV